MIFPNLPFFATVHYSVRAERTIKSFIITLFLTTRLRSLREHIGFSVILSNLTEGVRSIGRVKHRIPGFQDPRSTLHRPSPCEWSATKGRPTKQQNNREGEAETVKLTTRYQRYHRTTEAVSSCFYSIEEETPQDNPTNFHYLECHSDTGWWTNQVGPFHQCLDKRLPLTQQSLVASILVLLVQVG